MSLTTTSNGIEVVVPSGGFFVLETPGTNVMFSPSSRPECRQEAKTTRDGRLAYWYYWYVNGRGRFASGTKAARILRRISEGESMVIRGRMAQVLASRLVG